MTDIDTAAIRAEFVQTRHSQVDVTIGALCDALDAARAEADRRMSPPEMYWRKKCGEAAALYVKEMEAKFREQIRAEAAEAKFEKLTEQYRDVVGELLDRAEAAEARIAAALAVHSWREIDGDTGDQGEPVVLQSDVRRALGDIG
jgi:2C-methyl-D-erythritol 2,4-cyclodiphosphate synthase